MVDVPEARYAHSKQGNIAYQVVGDGPVSVVFVGDWWNHVEWQWEERHHARFLTRLASFSEALLDEIQEFLTGVREPPEPDRVLATVMFTDIVGSTEQAASLGDRAWRDVVERHHATVRHQLNRFRGREVDTAGDGFFATFDGPARAIRCAEAIRDAVRELGIDVRIGLHTGEC